MSDHSTSSGPAGSEHDGHDRSETGTAFRAKVRPIRLMMSAFIGAEHTVTVDRDNGSPYVRISFDDDMVNDIDLFFRETVTLDRLVEAATIAKKALTDGQDLRVCVTGGQPHQPHDEVPAAA